MAQEALVATAATAATATEESTPRAKLERKATAEEAHVALDTTAEAVTRGVGATTDEEDHLRHLLRLGYLHTHLHLTAQLGKEAQVHST